MGPGLLPLGQGPDLAVELMQLALGCVGSSGLSGAWSILFPAFTNPISTEAASSRQWLFWGRESRGDPLHWNPGFHYDVRIRC